MVRQNVKDSERGCVGSRPCLSDCIIVCNPSAQYKTLEAAVMRGTSHPTPSPSHAFVPPTLSPSFCASNLLPSVLSLSLSHPSYLWWLYSRRVRVSPLVLLPDHTHSCHAGLLEDLDGFPCRQPISFPLHQPLPAVI